MGGQSILSARLREWTTMEYTDGSTDLERLAELMSFGTEREVVDYKKYLDLGKGAPKDNISFVEDCLAMMNRPGGGYLVIGVDGSGNVAHDVARIDPNHFDPSILQEKVRAYCEAPVRINCTVHDLPERQVVLIYIYPAPGGLPVPAAKDGSYRRDGSPKSAEVFRRGDVVVREGTSNVRLRYSHWESLLESYRRQIREEARADVDHLIRRLAEHLAGMNTGEPSLPLDLELEHHDFAQAVRDHLDAGKTRQLHRVVQDFTAGTSRDASPDAEDLTNRLDKVAIIGVEAVRARNKYLYGIVLDALHHAYITYADFSSDSATPGPDGVHVAAVLLEFLKRLLAMGAAAVRISAWWAVDPIVSKDITVDGYRYGTWLRHGQVMAARARLLESKEKSTGGQLLSQALQLLIAVAELRPDVTVPDTGDERQRAARNLLLDSLCAFDLWWCVGASIRNADSPRSAYYPSFAAFHQHRVNRALRVIGSDEQARRKAFPGAKDPVIATHLRKVVELAVRESWNYGGFWSGLAAAPQAEQFVSKHAPSI